jgi:hypothetical protein
VRNNTITNAGANVSGSGIRVVNANTGSLNGLITFNTVSNVGLDYGIFADSAGGNTLGQGLMQVGVTSNNVSVLSTSLDGIRVQARQSNTVCGRVTGNTATAGAGFFGVFVRQAVPGVFNLEGGTAQLAANNPAATTGSTGTITTVGAGACTQIPAP